jgi:hypothetical protein
MQVCAGTQIPRVEKLRRDSGQHSCKGKETSQVLVDRATQGVCHSWIYFKLRSSEGDTKSRPSSRAHRRNFKGQDLEYLQKFPNSGEVQSSGGGVTTVIR